MAELESSATKNDRQVIKRERFKLNNDYLMKKRLPPRLPHRKNDVYINNKSSYQSQLSCCEKLLDSGEVEIIIHGLGAAVARAVNLALQLKDKYLGTVEISVNTSTIDIVDDFEPVSDQTEYETQTRQNSSVHIRVFRTALLGVQKP